MEKFALKKNSPKIDYFTYCNNFSQWYTAGAYDWVSQLGLCHKFINNRIIFLTADTGIGKSTEMPKLLMYYSKVIDCNNSPIIACTQPRKKPVQNVDFVSTTAGLPIFQWENGKIVHTKNNYFQYKHGEDDKKDDNDSEGSKGSSHPKRNDNNIEIRNDYGNHPILRFMTGDMLYNQIQEPTFKKINRLGMYTRNIYDIVIVDESHEHVTYMDLMMTFMKNSLTLNNSLRLIIVTATIDDDEYRYRRFYRDINDNKKFPLSTFISENNLDRINIDRRCHVSIKKGTRFAIVEHYKPLPDTKKETENKIIKQIIDEIMMKPKGNILIFEPGKKEIDDTVMFLNQNTNKNVIALQFYRELSEERQNVITNIDKKGGEIKLNKLLNFADEKNNYRNGTNSYDIFIIVATNIAEASITIPGLKYVIDTGTTKKNTFDYKQKCSVLKMENISESSRLQRKGRVGRTSPGEVYYLYEKDKMKDNKIKYEFSESDIHERLFKFLRKDTKQSNNLIYVNNLEDPKFRIEMIDDEKMKIIKQKYKYLKEQYFNGNNFYEYFGNPMSYDYHNYKPPSQYYDTGYDGKTLHDSSGLFYMIHPEELNLKRNLNGDIIGLRQIDDKDEIQFVKCDNIRGIIKSKKMVSFWKLLFDYAYIALDGNEIIRTDLCDLFVRLRMDKMLLLLEPNLCRSLLFAIINNCVNDMCGLISLMKSKFDKKDTKKEIIFDPDQNEFDFKNNMSGTNVSSDIDVIVNDVHNMKKKIVSLYHKNTHKNDEEIDDLFSKLIMFDIEDLKRNTDSAGEKWILQRGEEIRRWIKIKKSVNEFLKKNNGENLYLVNQIINRKKLNEIMMPKQSSFQKIKIALMLGFPHNFAKRIIKTPYFMSLYSPLYQNIFKIDQENGINRSFVDPIYLSNYIFYVKYDCMKSTILIVTHISPNDILLYLSHIYFNNLTYDSKKKEFIYGQIKKYENYAGSNPNPEINNFFKKMNIDGDINATIVNHMKNLMEIQNDFCNEKDIKTVIQSNKNMIIFEPKMKQYFDNLMQQNINKIMEKGRFDDCADQKIE
jgi:hypothetical protein